MARRPLYPPHKNDAKKRSKSNMVELTCCGCGVHAVFPASSPAAPVLTACEYANENHGWSYQVGFFTMLTGEHYPRCKECTILKRPIKDKFSED